MSGPHDARAIANALIDRGVVSRAPRDPLQIIKLTYLCHGWMLGLYNRPMSAQPVYAWRYGPVIPRVYHALKRYGKEPVTVPIDCLPAAFGDLEIDLIGQVFDGYEHYSGIDLSQMTHAPGTPWHQIRHTAGLDTIIPDEVIEEHFATIAES